MLKSLYWKLTLAFALVAFTTAALIAVAIRLTSADRLTKLIVEQQRTNLGQALQNYYTIQGSWEGIAERWWEIQAQTHRVPTPGGQPEDRPWEIYRPPGGQGRENFLGLADAQGVVIVPVDPDHPSGAQLPPAELRASHPVSVDGRPVGYILTARQPPGFSPQEALFLRRTTQALLYAGGGALLVALLVGILLARALTRPLQALTAAAHNITQGRLEQQVPVGSGDELGQLAAAFNTMSQEVARVNHLRRQMTADIAHDLRTPLTVISGYIESMRDGVLKPTPERLALIYAEIERLKDLVNDLRMLSLADAGELALNPQHIPPANLLERTAALFGAQAAAREIAITVQAPPGLPDIWVDEARMIQVLENLLSNALRHTPPGGRITLSARAVGGQVLLTVQDSGEGIPPEELPHVFNRFYRGDKARSAESGESGLGLAIVKALVTAQGGSATVRSAPGQGATFELTLPGSL